ncbi:MAG: LysR family transcriptional regulator, partial [Rhodospirillales bacterium]|nr:LysR family transcriptional regulator [Acetobacter sp.]
GRPLAGGRTLTLKDLDRQRLIMYAPVESRYHHDLVSSLFRTAGIAPNFVQYAGEVHTLLALVGAGIGVALVPKVACNLGFAGVQLQPINIAPKVFSELTFVWRKQVDNPALRVFTEDLLPKFVEVNSLSDS